MSSYLIIVKIDNGPTLDGVSEDVTHMPFSGGSEREAVEVMETALNR